MKKIWLTIVCCAVATGVCWSAKYKVKEIQVQPASEYAAHQDFQNIVLAARAYQNQEEILQIFDTKKLFEKNIVPVLVVVENNNDFAVRLHGRDIYLILEDGSNLPPLPLTEVLLTISLDKPLSGYATRKDILVGQVVKKELFMDFEHKAFQERLLAPQSSDYGVVFYSLPEGEDISKCRLYFPEVVNMTDEEALMFFEFALIPPATAPVQ